MLYFVLKGVVVVFICVMVVDYLCEGICVNVVNFGIVDMFWVG